MAADIAGNITIVVIDVLQHIGGFVSCLFTIGAGVGFDAHGIAGGISGDDTLVPVVLFLFLLAADAGMLVVGSVQILPITVKMSGRGDVLLHGVVAMDAGQKFGTVGGAGGFQGNGALIIGMLPGYFLAAMDADAGVTGFADDPVATHMIRQHGHGFFITVSADAGENFFALCFAGGLQGDCAFVITVFSGDFSTAVDATAGVAGFADDPVATHMIRQHRNGFLVAVSADAGHGLFAFCLAGGLQGDGLPVIDVFSGDFGAAVDAGAGVAGLLDDPVAAYMIR